MDQTPPMLPADLSVLLGAASAPALVDLRTAEEISDRLIPGALRRPPADVQSWWSDLPRARPVVLFDLVGGESSVATAAALRHHGLQARHLEGGFAAWRE